jgi:hemoglobin/transferrin/lactoferrin receptor protein
MSVTPAWAQTSPTFEEVVVTASRGAQSIFDSPKSISVIDSQMLDRSTAYSVADLLRDVPGVQVTDSGQPGLKRIRLRGEESRRTAILVNSQELTDHREVGTPLTLHPAMVERIEVIRGSGSVLYGSRALSGVVNFLTRKGGTAPLQATVSASYDSATTGHSAFGSVFGNVKGFEYRLAYAESDHDERNTPQGEIQNTAFDNSNAYIYLGKGFGDQRLDYTYEDFESSSDIFVEEEVRTSFPLTDFYLETPQRDRERHALAYDWDAEIDWLDRLQFNGFYQLGDRRFLNRTDTIWYEREVDNESELTTWGGLTQLDAQPVGDHRFIAGLQYLDDSVDQSRRVDTFSWTPSTPTGLEVIDDKAKIETWAWFAQDEWSLRDRTTLTVGLRQYFVDAELEASNRESLVPGKLDEDDELIGALGLVFEARDDLHLRANIAQGYVYPSLMQLATGAYAGSSFVNPNPDLDPETSVNYELGMRLQRPRLTLDVTAFYSESEDYIHHLACTEADNCPGSRDRRYRNIGESRAHGLEVFGQYTHELGFVPYLNITWIKRKNEYETFSTWDSGVPDFAGRAGARWEGRLGKLTQVWSDLFLRGESASELTEPGTHRTVVEDRSSWWSLNLAAGTSLGDSGQYQVALELHNLTDETYVTSGENLYAPERSASIKLTMDWR